MFWTLASAASGILIALTLSKTNASPVSSFNKDISVNSSFGQKLLESARKVEVNYLEKTRDLEAYGGVDVSWLPDYSLKVQGCSHVTSWNGAADDENDVKLRTKRLIKFRLCPVDDCNSYSSYGCNGDSYGDYIVDLDIFLANYIEWLQEDLYKQCQEYAWYTCNCYDDDNKDDKFDQSQCEFQCWYKTGKEECYTDYTQDDDASGFQLDNYMQCSPWYPPGYNGRRTEEAEEEEEEEEEEEQQQDDNGNDDNSQLSSNRIYYLGPHCEDKSSVYMGLFLDEACTSFADDSDYGAKAYKTFTGNDLPYSLNQQELVKKECMSCANDDDDGTQAQMLCQGSYVSAAKCEKHLGNTYPNEGGCNFINGINYVEQYAKKKHFNPFSYIYSWADDYPDFFMIALGSIFGFTVIRALMMKRQMYKTIENREKSKEIAFNAAQVESHYTDTKVKDAFLAM